MPDFTIDLVFDMPVQLIYVYFFAKLLPMRHVVPYAIIRLFMIPFLVNVGYRFMNAWAATAVIMLVTIVLPFLWFEGKGWLKAIVVLAANAVQLGAEVVSEGAWSLMAGSAVPADFELARAFVWGNVPAYLFSNVVEIILVALFLSILRAFVQRHARKSATRSWLFVAFLATQFALLWLAVLITAKIDTSFSNYYGAMFVLSSICVIADILLFISMERYLKKELEDERIRLLQQEFNRHLDRYNVVVENVERISKMRHDLRNQMQVVIMLADRGDREQARGHLLAIMKDVNAIDIQTGTTR